MQLARARVRQFTVGAMVAGAIPVPAASIAIIAENAAMVNAVASAMGVPVSIGTVTASFGLVGGLNLIGRNLFVEGARALGWFGGPFGVVAVSGLGATTAGLQTWLLGELTIAICENGGAPLEKETAERVIGQARIDFNAVRGNLRRTAARGATN